MLPTTRTQTQPAIPSSTMLWAQASKEWVIPAKPKPGRKPKKDIMQPVDREDEVDAKGRRIQNRAAQRAFRERKQTQLADLQARLQSYEQGEIERNVALQNVAKRLKEENDTLKNENKTLKEETSRLKSELESIRFLDRKRWRLEDSYVEMESSRKRLRIQTEASLNMIDTSHSSPNAHTPPSIASSPDSRMGSITFSPLPLVSSSGVQSAFDNQVSLSQSLNTFSGLLKGSEPEPSFDAFDCGLCNENTPCVCREIALNQVAAAMADERTTLKIETVDQAASSDLLNSTSSLQSSTMTSILDNLPEYQPAVPLRRDPLLATSTSRTPLFQIRLQSPYPEAEDDYSYSKGRDMPGGVVCSGDPSNCPACADDTFGKAFCAALGNSVSSIGSCSSCPNAREDGLNSADRRSLPSEKATNMTISQSRTQNNDNHYQAAAAETIPCSEAWRQLKSHPNIAFADLSMLADVVARRTKCNGPHIDTGSITSQECIATPSNSAAAQGTSEDNLPILLIDPHERYRKGYSSHTQSQGSFSLVPEDVLLRCGRKRLLQVDAAGVKEALRILDGQFGRP